MISESMYAAPATEAQYTTDQQRLQANALRDVLNRQQQTPYADANGMNKTGTGSTATATSVAPNTAQRIGGSTSTSTSAPSGSTGSTSGTGISPVTSNGRINPAAAPPPAPVSVAAPVQAAPAPAPAPVAAPAPQLIDHKDPAWAAKGVDFNKLNGGEPVPGMPGYTFVHNGQGWTLAPPAAAPAAPAPGPAQPPAGAPPPATQPGYPGQYGPTTQNPWGDFATPNYEAGAIGNPNTVAYANPLGPNRFADTLYKPATITQNPGTINEGLEGTVQTALEKAIAGGGGLDVAGLKAKHLDDTLAMRDDSLEGARSAAAGAGRLGSGFQAANEANMREKAIEAALGGYRDIDIDDAKLRNDNLYRGAELGNTVLTGQATRRLGDYAATLEGQLKQEGLYKDASGNSRDNYLADLTGAGQAAQNNTARDVANIGGTTSRDVAGINAASNKEQSRMGLLGDILNIMERARSSDQSTGLGFSQLTQQYLR